MSRWLRRDSGICSIGGELSLVFFLSPSASSMAGRAELLTLRATPSGERAGGLASVYVLRRRSRLVGGLASGEGEDEDEGSGERSSEEARA